MIIIRLIKIKKKDKIDEGNNYKDFVEDTDGTN